MARLGLRCLARLGVGLLLTLLLGELLSPSVARAACGDHVHVSRPLAGPIHDPINLPALPAGPCTGTACSSPEPVPLAPVAPSPTLPDLWGQPAALIDHASDGPPAWLSASDPPPCRSTASSIFHPPR